MSKEISKYQKMNVDEIFDSIPSYIRNPEQIGAILRDRKSLTKIKKIKLDKSFFDTEFEKMMEEIRRNNAPLAEKLEHMLETGLPELKETISKLERSLKHQKAPKIKYKEYSSLQKLITDFTKSYNEYDRYNFLSKNVARILNDRFNTNPVIINEIFTSKIILALNFVWGKEITQEFVRRGGNKFINDLGLLAFMKRGDADYKSEQEMASVKSLFNKHKIADIFNSAMNREFQVPFLLDTYADIKNDTPFFRYVQVSVASDMVKKHRLLKRERGNREEDDVEELLEEIEDEDEIKYEFADATTWQTKRDNSKYKLIKEAEKKKNKEKGKKEKEEEFEFNRYPSFDARFEYKLFQAISSQKPIGNIITYTPDFNPNKANKLIELFTIIESKVRRYYSLFIDNYTAKLNEEMKDVKLSLDAEKGEDGLTLGDMVDDETGKDSGLYNIRKFNIFGKDLNKLSRHPQELTPEVSTNDVKARIGELEDLVKLKMRKNGVITDISLIGRKREDYNLRFKSNYGKKQGEAINKLDYLNFLSERPYDELLKKSTENLKKSTDELVKAIKGLGINIEKSNFRNDTFKKAFSKFINARENKLKLKNKLSVISDILEEEEEKPKTRLVKKKAEKVIKKVEEDIDEAEKEIDEKTKTIIKQLKGAIKDFNDKQLDNIKKWKNNYDDMLDTFIVFENQILSGLKLVGISDDIFSIAEEEKIKDNIKYSTIKITEDITERKITKSEKKEIEEEIEEEVKEVAVKEKPKSDKDIEKKIKELEKLLSRKYDETKKQLDLAKKEYRKLERQIAELKRKIRSQTYEIEKAFRKELNKAKQKDIILKSAKESKKQYTPRVEKITSKQLKNLNSKFTVKIGYSFPMSTYEITSKYDNWKGWGDYSASYDGLYAFLCEVYNSGEYFVEDYLSNYFKYGSAVRSSVESIIYRAVLARKKTTDGIYAKLNRTLREDIKKAMILGALNIPKNTEGTIEQKEKYGLIAEPFIATSTLIDKIMFMFCIVRNRDGKVVWSGNWHRTQNFREGVEWSSMRE